MENLNDDLDIYVCITHHRVCPCQEEGKHLISNWAIDVRKIISLMEEKNG